MASASNPIHVRRPKAVVFDILGTASKSGFLERILFPYLKIHLETYLTHHWDQRDFKHLFKRIQDNSVELNKAEPSTPIVLAHNTNQAKSSLLNFLNFCTENGLQSPPVTQLRFKVWFEGYQSSKLLTPIYSDVPASLRRWFSEGIKFYVFSNTWVEAQKALLRNTTHGDLTNLITSYYDNDFGQLTESESWRRFCLTIKQRPEDTLFLTKSVQEGRAAMDAGLGVVLVLTHRHNVKAVGHEDRTRFPYVRTLNDLQWTDAGPMPTGPADQANSVMPAGPSVATQMTQAPSNVASPSTTTAAGSTMPSTAAGSAATAGASPSTTMPLNSVAPSTAAAASHAASHAPSGRSHSRSNSKKPSQAQ